MNTDKLVDGPRLLAALFDPPPSERWLRYKMRQRVIPFLKIGRLVRFDVAKVRAALDKHSTVQAKRVA